MKCSSSVIVFVWKVERLTIDRVTTPPTPHYLSSSNSL